MTKEELVVFYASHEAAPPSVDWGEYSNLIFEELTDGGLSANYDALIPISVSPSQKMPVKMRQRIDPNEEPQCESTVHPN